MLRKNQTILAIFISLLGTILLLASFFFPQNNLQVITSENAGRVKVMHTFEPEKNDGGFLKVSFDSKGSGCLLASTSYYKNPTIQIFDTCSQKLVKTFDTEQGLGAITAIFHPAKPILAVTSWDQGSDGRLELWDINTGQVLQKFNTNRDFEEIEFGYDRKILAAVGGNSNRLYVWDSETGNLLYEPRKSIGSGLAINPNGKLIAFGASTAWEDGPYISGVKFLDLQTGIATNFMLGTENLRSLAFNPDGSLLAIGGRYDCSINSDKYGNKSVRIWEMKAQQVIKTLEGHQCDIRAVIFSPNGRLLASASNDMTIKLWDVTTGKLLNTLYGHGDAWINSIAFNKNGTLLASSGGNFIRIWGVPNY